MVFWRKRTTTRMTTTTTLSTIGMFDDDDEERRKGECGVKPSPSESNAVKLIMSTRTRMMIRPCTATQAVPGKESAAQDPTCDAAE